MEDAIIAHIPDTRTTTIICRSGKLHEPYCLGLCSVDTCKSVIVNVHDDAETVKVLGSNSKLPLILAEYNLYVEPHTRVTIVDNELSEAGLGTHDNLDITVCPAVISRELLAGFVADGNTNMLLNDDSLDAEASDSQTMLRLILLRDISDKTGTHLTITTEMCNTDNQRLAMQARVDDFVISTDFVSLLMAQISEEPDLKTLIDDLLDEDGSELYLKPAVNYVTLGEEVDGYTITESAAARGRFSSAFAAPTVTARRCSTRPRITP